eukprot:CAMPEP_0204379784 /NCGR_PEP_ID=MMETSP0469-20131031/52852_1 /ASSEMBLY_ACC=CAM_ASM_000384 /TAXON_ID=2969 /ORGANISM="Oxyrrhis marina" /LENGTH=380 /DNA_ID=CAMNT_0051371303 /DNA_START=1 /DNA_END=1143 /DNA_ORIENTATION=-
MPEQINQVGAVRQILAACAGKFDVELFEIMEQHYDHPDLATKAVNWLVAYCEHNGCDGPKYLHQYNAFCQLREATASRNTEQIKAACVVAKRVPNLKDHRQLDAAFAAAIAGLRIQESLPAGWNLEKLLGDSAHANMYGLFPVRDDSKIALFQELLKLTYRQRITRDRKAKLASSFEVSRVVEVQNVDTYQKYLKRRQVVTESCRGASPPDAPISAKQWKAWGGPVMTSPVAQRITAAFELDALHQHCNEFLLFHGTKATVEQSIAENNFDISYAKNGMFGVGLYFAESCSKSDEYVTPNDSEEYPLLLVRVTVGKPNYVDNKNPSVNPGRRQMEDSCKNGAHHSVLGDRRKCSGTYREFIVYDNAQAYPHFIVWYKRKY